MASNKRFLKAYARFDGSGRIVTASTILRKNKPKVGSWKEVQTYLCCNPTELFYTPTLPITGPYVRIFCDEVQQDSGTAGSGPYTNVTDLIENLNADGDTSVFGTYSAGPNGSVKLTLSPAALALCPTGTLSFDIIPD
jgi:hypothetical protein